MAHTLQENPTTKKLQWQIDDGNFLGPDIYINTTQYSTYTVLGFVITYSSVVQKKKKVHLPDAQENGLQVDSRLQILKTVEKKRFEERVEKALKDQGKLCRTSIIKKLTRLKPPQWRESTDGEFHVDLGKFFKKQATEFDVPIFEETGSRSNIKQKSNRSKEYAC
jgi:hypothetical protein